MTDLSSTSPTPSAPEFQGSTPLRILFICHDGSIYGSQRSLELVVRNLPSEKYQCFISLARSGPLKEQLADCPNVTFLQHRRLQWVKHDRRNLAQRLGDVFSLLVSAPSRVWRLSELIRKHDIQLVHTNSTVSPEGALAAAIAKIPHVWHIRELFMEPSPKFHMVLGCSFSRRVICHFSDAVICISGAVRRQFGRDAERHPSQFQLVYNALDYAQSSALSQNPDKAPQIRHLCQRALELPVKNPEGKTIWRLGYIGRLSAGKGLHELLEGLAILRQRGLPVELIVTGDFVDSSYLNRITRQLERHQLGSVVRFLGYREDLSTLYPVMDAFVLPSLNEPFGRVLIEAMRQGIPCVAAAAGGVPEIIEDGVTGMLYPPGKPEAMADALERLLTSPLLQEAFVENAGRMVRERFTIETQIKMLDQCYQSLLRHHLLK